MPAFQTTLRFLALGACADVATAFGTFSGVKVESQSTGGGGGSDCACEEAWYCQISGPGSIKAGPLYSGTLLGSTGLEVFAGYVSYCWNKCYKDPRFLDPTYWTADANGDCAACANYEDTYRCPFPPCDISSARTMFGCQCGTQAEDWDDCKGTDAAGGGQPTADLWREAHCDNSGTYKPWSVAFANDTFICILNGIDRASCNSATYANRGNPFRDSYEWYGDDGVRDGSDTSPVGEGGGWLYPICSPPTASNICPMDCSVILSEGSKDVTGTTCEAAGPSEDCTKLYSYSTEYGARTASYCVDDKVVLAGVKEDGTVLRYFETEFSYTTWGAYVATCASQSLATCGTVYTRPGWGGPNRILYCRVNGNGDCVKAAPVSVNWPILRAGDSLHSCKAPTDPCLQDAGPCKRELCGDPTDSPPWSEGERKCDAACGLGGGGAQSWGLC